MSKAHHTFTRVHFLTSVELPAPGVTVQRAPAGVTVGPRGTTLFVLRKPVRKASEQ